VKSQTNRSTFRRMLGALALGGVITASSTAWAAPLNLTLGSGTNVVGGGSCATAAGSPTTVNGACRYTNVVQGVGAASPFQRDAVITIVSFNGGATVGATFDNDAETYVTAGAVAIAGTHPEVFSPTVVAPSAANRTAWVEFRIDFFAAGTNTPSALPGTVFTTSLDTDGDGTANALREFVEFASPTLSGIASPTNLLRNAAGTPVATGGQNFLVNLATNSVNGITIDPQYKATGQYDTPTSITLRIGSIQGSVATGATGRLSAYSLQIADAVLKTPVVDGFKSVTTTDNDGNGLINAGDTLTYTVTYVNTGNAPVSNFQIVDALPTGTPITAGSQTVSLNGTVTAGAGNAAYTGSTNTNLLAVGQTLPVGGTIKVTIPVTIGAVGADNTVLSNQTTTSGTYVNEANATVNLGSVGSDNVDATTTFLPVVSAATGFGTVPAGSLAQTQAPSVDPTKVTVRRLPTLTLSKVSNGGFGAFSFSGTNGFANQTITTTTSGTAVSGATQTLTAASKVTIITETIPSGYVMTAFTCTNLGTGGTATPNLAAGSVTLDAAATAFGSAITCTVTNTRSPTISLQKAFGAGGRVVATDQFTLAIGGTNVTTTGTGSSVTSPAASLNPAVALTAYTLSETGVGTPAANLSSYTTTYVCTNTRTGGQTPSGTGTSFSVTPVAGDVLSCTFTNTPVILADLSISKTGSSNLVAGETGSYTLKVWNQGPSPMIGATIADAVPANLSGVSWTCTATGLATCGTASGTGNAISFVSGLLPVNTTTGAAGATNAAPTSGDYLTITVTGTAATTGDLTNTATVTAPVSVTDGYAANNTASQATRIVPTPFTPTTPAICSTLPGFTGLGPNLVTAFNNGTFGTSTGDPLVAGSNTKSPTAWPYLATNIPNYGYVQITANSPQDGSLSLVSRMSDPRIFGVWSNTLTPIIVDGAGAAVNDTATGRFLLINGANQGQSIIETSITGLSANTNYQVLGLFANVIDSGGNQVLPNLNYNIGGVSYYKTGTIVQDNNGAAPTATNQAKWRQAGFVFNTGNSTSVTFAMVSNVPAANGNDFAFDQLALNQCQGTYVNTLSGFLYGDNNGNASFQNPAEPQLPAGVTVDLQYLDPNGNPVTVAKTTTGLVSGASNTGKYVFTNVPPPPTGFTYFVHVENGSVVGEPTTVPAGYTLTTANNVAISNVVGAAATPNYVSGTNLGPDFGFSVPVVAPAISLLKLGRNVTKNTTFIDGIGSVGVLPGDVLEYCLVYTNTGGVASNFKITDYVPVGMVTVPDAYAAANGVRWADGVTIGTGAAAAPAGTNLSNAADTDAGTLSAAPVLNPNPPGDGLIHPGLLTLNLGATGLAANGKGTVCFQTKVP
jgi:uncharacterized repeat protein (TIGR01451 family)